MLQVIEADIYGLAPTFNSVLSDRSIKFEREAEFAIQILSGNDYSMKLAFSNRQSVVNAVTNLAAIGLSLNPARKLAYLVPRDKRICLDISYMGLVELAVASGSVRWAKAELVRAGDRFQLNGMDKLPTHDFEPFATDRGDIIGVYCVAKTADGDYLTDTMSLADVYDIRDRSSAWKAWISSQKKCPWVTDEGEMIKKTIVKRASKMWPKTDRLDQAIHHLNVDGEEGLAPADDAPQSERVVFDLQRFTDEASKAGDVKALEDVWRRGAKAAEQARDKKGYVAFKQAVINRKTKLEAVDA